MENSIFNFLINNSTFVKNQAHGNGGGMYIDFVEDNLENFKKFDINVIVFDNNKADGNEGEIITNLLILSL